MYPSLFSAFSLFLLFGNAIAYPILTQPPTIGDVVRIRPDDTDGAPNVLTAAGLPNSGGDDFHPHIILGLPTAPGHPYVVGPISHAPDNRGFEPKTPAQPFHNNLGGNLHLGHVTAHINHMEPPSNRHQGINIAQWVPTINQYKQEEHSKAHRGAARQHDEAEAAHLKAKQEHSSLALASHNAGMQVHPASPEAQHHRNAYIFHSQQVDHHQHRMNHHRNEAIIHRTASSHTPSTHSIAHANISRQGAWNSVVQADASRAAARAQRPRH